VLRKNLFRNFLIALLLVAAGKNCYAQTTYWWNDAVFYEAFVRSFYDSSGDGIGDLKGLTEKLDYLDELGVNAIWLMPVNPSPSYHGYDVTNYKDVQAAYGTKQQYIAFVDSAHKRGIKVIFDFVMNHSSSSHPWFVKSKANDPLYKDFYVWSPINPGNTGPWGQQVWYYYNSTMGYYYALFWSGMPDLNYNTQAVRDSMFSYAAFWLDSMHVDGFRLDAAPYLYEDGDRLYNCPQTLQFWQDFHTYYKSINDSAITVGEVWYPTDSILPYVVGGDKLDFCFEFDLAGQIISAFNTGSIPGLRNEMQYDYDHYPYLQFGTFLSNHDQDRVIDKFSSNFSKMKAAAATYLTLPGIPFLYYGEEIGMIGSGADENKRRPMQWTSGAHAGFTTGTPWESINSNYVTYNVATEEADSNSLLNWYKKLIALRHQEVALRKGNYVATANASGSIYSFLREYEGDTLLVIVNTGSQAYTDFTVNMNGTGIQEGYKSLNDLLTPVNSFIGEQDDATKLGTFDISAYGVLIYRMESSTGISNLFSTQGMKVFPNPASDIVVIEIDGYATNPVSFSVVNANGKVLRTEKANIDEGKLNINVADLPNGIYFLKPEEKYSARYFKIVVAR